MSDFTNTEYDENGEPIAPQHAPGESPRDLREAADRSKQHKAEADAAKRELAFYKAGVDLDSKRGQTFARAYDGDLSPEAIKAEYDEVFGAAPAPETPPQAAPVDRDTAQMQAALAQQTAERRELASVGTDHTEPPPADPRPAAMDKFYEDVASGTPRERAFTGVLNSQIAASNAGIEGATWRGQWTDEELGK